MLIVVEIAQPQAMNFLAMKKLWPLHYPLPRNLWELQLILESRQIINCSVNTYCWIPLHNPVHFNSIQCISVVIAYHTQNYISVFLKPVLRDLRQYMFLQQNCGLSGMELWGSKNMNRLGLPEDSLRNTNLYEIYKVSDTDISCHEVIGETGVVTMVYNSLDSLQFVYHPHMGGEDTIIFLLHQAYTYLITQAVVCHVFQLVLLLIASNLP